MKIEDIKKIPIVELLSNLGFEPAYRTGGGKQCVYHSLFNTDLTPSFSVSVPKNVWFDFSSNIGGNIIDLAMAIKGCSFSSAVYWLEEQYRSFGGVSRLEFSIMGTYDETIENTLCKVSTVPLERPALKKYLSSRGILPEVSEMYCRGVNTSRGAMAPKPQASFQLRRPARRKAAVSSRDSWISSPTKLWK